LAEGAAASPVPLVLAQPSTKKHRLRRRAAEDPLRVAEAIRRLLTAVARMTRRDQVEVQVMSVHLSISLAWFRQVDREWVGTR
jgi:hypothetical protein